MLHVHEAICLFQEKKRRLPHHLPLNDSYVRDPKTSPHPAPATVVVNIFLKCLPRCNLRVSAVLPSWGGRHKLLVPCYKEAQM